MPGLLGDGFDDPRSAAVMALSGGLLRGDFGGGLLGANSAFQDARMGAMKRNLLDAQLQETLAQADQRKTAAMQQQAALERAARIQANAPNLLGGGAGGAGGFDVRQALALGMTPKEISEYAGLSDVGRPKASRQIEVDDGQGGKRVALVDDFGREVAGYAGYTAPVQVNQGDRVSFVRPNAGVSLPVGMSPSERDASARGWAGVGIQRQQLEQGKAPAGYRMRPDGTMEVIPGGPADLKNSAEGQKKVADAKDVLGLLDEVDTLLPKATGSYAGAGADQAARVFGLSTPGAEATAQLKTLQGALISKMPKMSGPQSDKDVQLYREMAGQVGDPTLPVSTRQKASETIRHLNEKYAGVPGGSSKKTVVKTGMYGGRKVEQLSDGSVRYAD